MAFNKRSTTKNVADSPEAMLHDIRNKKIAGPMASQADIWREYVANNLQSKDVAIRMPTGAGKTLVGIALAEWRRRKFGQKVVFLCPTVQLVAQVTEQAKVDYGIEVMPFVGAKRGYSPQQKASYSRNSHVSVTTYSSLFNSNPFFQNADILIFDDAHSAENYVGAMWTLDIPSFDGFEDLYRSVISIVEGHYPELGLERKVYMSRNTEGWVEKIPSPIFREMHESIRTQIDSFFSSEMQTSSQYYNWSVIKEHLDACHCYIDAGSIIIRPLVPPTFSHAAFSKPEQRIYMSATLGSGGDLERIFGRHNISRILIDTIESKEIGRRFFLFPEVAFLKDEVEQLIAESIDIFGRALFITPNNQSLHQRVKVLDEIDDLGVLGIDQFIEDKSLFLSNDKAALVLANRYDGIDFPGEQCAMLVLEGLPKAQNLQEKFLFNKMGCQVLFADRLKTRITQAFGRCTRANSDFALVIVLGDEWLDFLLDDKTRSLLHAEIQAEIRFGDEQSETNLANLLENIQSFKLQNDDWLDAADEIVSYRSECEQVEPEEYEVLQEAVRFEVQYAEALWSSDFAKAYTNCREILSLINNPALRGYRALWHYLAGSTIELARANNRVLSAAESQNYHYLQAKEATRAISWLNDLAAVKTNSIDENETQAQQVLKMVEGIETQLNGLGIRSNRKFIQKRDLILSGLGQSESKKFEKSQVLLGELLGFIAGNEEYSAAPDPWWYIDESLCFVFEDNTENTSGVLSVEKARQVCLHDNWIRENVPGVTEKTEIVKILVTPAKKLSDGAILHLDDVFAMSNEEFYQWAKHAIETIELLRDSLMEQRDLIWKDNACEIIKSKRCTPKDIYESFCKHSCKDFFEA